MDAEGRWTLDELVRLVADALAGGAYPGAPNGRVRDVPDRRAVRWYTTIGLVDRPAMAGGRAARYGPRHLLQLVAVKRRQAQGRTLAEIQAELAGATEATLHRIAALPEGWPAAAGAPAPDTGAARGPDAGSAAGVDATAAPASAAAPPGAPPWAADPTPDTAPPPVRHRFWAERPSSGAGAPAAGAPGPGAPGPGAPGPGAPGPGAPAVPLPATLTGIPLAPAVVLLVPGRPGDDDLPAIHAAARPLLELLADRGLGTPPTDGRST